MKRTYHLQWNERVPDSTQLGVSVLGASGGCHSFQVEWESGKADPPLIAWTEGGRVRFFVPTLPDLPEGRFYEEVVPFLPLEARAIWNWPAWTAPPPPTLVQEPDGNLTLTTGGHVLSVSFTLEAGSAAAEQLRRQCESAGIPVQALDPGTS